MNARTLQKLEKALLDLKRDVLARLSGSTPGQLRALAESRSSLIEDSDIASHEVTEHILFGLNQSDRLRLQHVERALRRIEVGSYGTCIECGELIEIARLHAAPFSQTCIQCQEQRESW